MFFVKRLLRWRSSSPHIFMRNTICSSPSITSLVTLLPKPALKRKKLLKLQVFNINHKCCFSLYDMRLLSDMHNTVFVWLCVIVGYAWLPLLKDGRLSSQEFSISVSCTLPGGYLLIKEPTSTKVSTGGHINRFTFLFYLSKCCFSPCVRRTARMWNG